MKYTPLYNLIIRGYHKSWVIIRVSIYKPRGVALAPLSARPSSSRRPCTTSSSPSPPSSFVRIFQPSLPLFLSPLRGGGLRFLSVAILSFLCDQLGGWSRPKDPLAREEVSLPTCVSRPSILPCVKRKGEEGREGEGERRIVVWRYAR